MGIKQMENMPCKGCLCYPICLNKKAIKCTLLWNWYWEDDPIIQDRKYDMICDTFASLQDLGDTTKIH